MTKKPVRKLFSKFNLQSRSLPLTVLLLIFLFILPVTVIFMGVRSLKSPEPPKQRLESLAETSNWYSSSWSYRKKITIDHTKVQADLTNFPVLINLSSDSDLAFYAQNDGDDILFTASNGTTKLPHELEKFDNLTGELVAHVKVSSLSPTTDTEIYMYYGNPDASSASNGKEKTDLDNFEQIGLYEGTNPVIPVGNSSASDRFIREIGNVLYEPNGGDKKYKTWYTGYTSQTSGGNIGEKIHYAYSDDGITWTKSTANPVINNREAEDPYVVKKGSVYYLYAEDKEKAPYDKVRRWHSADGEGWINDGQVTGVSNVVSPVIWIENGIWYMLYERFPASPNDVWLATSGDGLVWTDHPANPVFEASETAWTTGAIVPCDIIKRGSNYYFFYGSSYRVGVAMSTNLIGWREYAKNPISSDELNFPTIKTASIFPDTEDVFLYYASDEKGIYRGYPIRDILAESTKVWDDNFEMVQHLDKMKDSTANKHEPSSTISPSLTVGKIGNARDFNGNNSYLQIANESQFDFTGNFTVEGWVSFNTLPSTGFFNIISKGYDGSTQPFFLDYYANIGKLRFGSFSEVQGNSNVDYDFSTTGFFVYIVGVRDGNTWRIYLNGDQKNTSVNSGQWTNNKSVSIGALDLNGSWSRFFNGTIDEVRISNVARSTTWIKTTYNNQSSPSSFYAVSPPQTPVSPTPTPTPTPTQTPIPTATRTPIPSPSPTPILIPTSTPTVTLTPTFTPTPTPTPTPIPQASLTLKIKFQGISSGVASGKNVRVILKQGSVEKYRFDSLGITHEGGGIYRGTISNINPDNYDVLIKGWAHLQRKFNTTLTSGGNTRDWSGTLLLAGDIDFNGRITSLDLGKVLDDYWPDTPPNSPADLNLDGKVSALDLGPVLDNYFEEDEK